MGDLRSFGIGLCAIVVSLGSAACADDDVQAIIDNLPTAHYEIRQKKGKDAEDALAKMHEWDLSVARSIRDGDCETALSLLAFDLPKESAELNEAILMMEGRCLERQFEEVSRILHTETPWLWDHVRLARLGTLYLNGDGVAKDKARDRRLFRRAAVAMGNFLMGWLSHAESEEDIAMADVWQTTPRALALGFANAKTGPWELPSRLRREVDWVLAAERQGAAAALQIAKWLRRGTQGFERDDAMAVEWLRIAMQNEDFAEAKRVFIEWAYDDGFCRDDDVRCQRSWFEVNWRLEELAILGDPEATAFLLRCIGLVPHYPNRELAVYSWLAERKRRGWSYNEAELQAAHAALGEEEIEMLDSRQPGDFGLLRNNLGDFRCPRD